MQQKQQNSINILRVYRKEFSSVLHLGHIKFYREKVVAIAEMRRKTTRNEAKFLFEYMKSRMLLSAVDISNPG